MKRISTIGSPSRNKKKIGRWSKQAITTNPRTMNRSSPIWTPGRKNWRKNRRSRKFNRKKVNNPPSFSLLLSRIDGLLAEVKTFTLHDSSKKTVLNCWRSPSEIKCQKILHQCFRNQISRCSGNTRKKGGRIETSNWIKRWKWDHPELIQIKDSCQYKEIHVSRSIWWRLA